MTLSQFRTVESRSSKAIAMIFGLSVLGKIWIALRIIDELREDLKRESIINSSSTHSKSYVDELLKL